MYLLDTSVFYSIGDGDKADRFLKEFHESYTSISSLLEIMSGLKDKNGAEYEKRIKALKSLNKICGKTKILRPNTDICIDNAFGVNTAADIDVDRIWKGVDLALKSKSMDDLDHECIDWLSREKVSLNVQEMRNWDDKTQSYFKTSVDDSLKSPDPFILNILKTRYGLSDRESKKHGREIMADYCQTKDYFNQSVLSLAMRAGVIDFASYELSSDADKERALMIALDRYDGSLDFFIVIWQKYQSIGWLGRNNAGRNDGLDLDPLVYLKSGLGSKYITGETFWVDLINSIEPEKTINVRGQYT